jgi:hypothetical protein
VGAAEDVEDDGGVNIEVLHIVDCPSWVAVGDRLTEALRATGCEETVIRYQLVETAEDAARLAFAGSPTILVDGEDLFPGAARTSDLACRVYATPVGVAGLPTTEQLIEVIGSRGR